MPTAEVISAGCLSVLEVKAMAFTTVQSVGSELKAGVKDNTMLFGLVNRMSKCPFPGLERTIREM